MELRGKQLSRRRIDTRKKSGKVKRLLAAAAAAAVCTFAAADFSSVTEPIRENIVHAEEARPRQDSPDAEESGSPGTLSIPLRVFSQEELLAEEEPPVATPEPAQETAPEPTPEPSPGPVLEFGDDIQEEAPRRDEADDASVDTSDQPSLDNDFDIGTDLFFTESGAASLSVLGSYSGSYGEWGSLGTGVMWFPSIANSDVGFAPFGVLRLTPGIDRRGIHFRSYSSIAGTMLNSELFAFQSFGLGFTQKRGEFELRGAAVLGGAIAYPHFDLIYADLRIGASLSWNSMVTMYGAMSFYAAANSPAETAYVGFYRPRFQSIDVGIEVAIRQWLLDVRGRYDVVRSGLTVGIERDLYFGGMTMGTVGVSLGFANWSERLAEAGRAWELVVLGNFTVRLPGRHVNSTNEVTFQHMHGGGISQADLDLDNPYINRTYLDERAMRIEGDLQGATSMEDLTGRYSEASFEELIWFARIIAHRGHYLYSHAANEAMMGMRFFDSEVERIARMDYDQGLGYIGAYLRLLNSSLTLDNMPEYLQRGLGICPFIHDLAAEFLRRNGVHAITASVNTTTEPHVILMALDGNMTVLIDYGAEYRTASFDEALRLYGEAQGAMIFVTQLQDEHYIGTFVSSEGRTVIHTLGFDNLELLFHDFLGLRSRRH